MLESISIDGTTVFPVGTDYLNNNYPTIDIMAKLIVKNAATGEEFDIENIDLKQYTPRQLIDMMITQGFLPPETIASYGIVNKINVMIDDNDLCLSFSQLGFSDGDTIEIIMKAFGGEKTSISHSNNSISDFSYESTPIGSSLEEKAQQLADEKLAILQLEQMRKEEDRCMAHIAKISHRINEQKHFENHCMMLNDELSHREICVSATKRFDSIDKMQDLLTIRLAQLQNSGSFFDRLRVEKESHMIRELLKLVQSIKIEQKEMLQQIEVLFHTKMRESAYQLSYSGIRANKETVDLLESFLYDYKKELYDLIDRRKYAEIELDKKQKEREADEVYSSIFAPAEVKPKSRMFVQVYLHLYEETEKVKELASESDKNAERRDYIPLQCKLKRGDKVDVVLNIYGETLLMSDKKSVVWQGSFTKCSFDCFVPKDINADELSCVAILSVNGVPIGEMRFITKIVEFPRQLNPKMLAHKYDKVFISYSHEDESKVKFLHEGLELGSVPHFFDRKYLKAGDVFPQVIKDYINSADLFILCWSENASNSEYVQKERLQALERAYPQVQPEQAAKLRIYPMSIEPRAELPSDMKNYYHFGEI